MSAGRCAVRVAGSTAPCRWLAYSGSPSSSRSCSTGRRTPGRPEPALADGSGGTKRRRIRTRLVRRPRDGSRLRSIEPVAWNDRNLRALSAHLTSGLFLAHIRASTGSPVQQTNCHPFQHGRAGSDAQRHDPRVPRGEADLTLAVSPELPGHRRYDRLRGDVPPRTDVRAEEDLPAAVARTIGLVEQAVGREHGVEHPFQGTIATSDGECIWAFRHSSERQSRSLFFSTDAARCGPCIRRTSSCERWGTRLTVS